MKTKAELAIAWPSFEGMPPTHSQSAKTGKGLLFLFFSFTSDAQGDLYQHSLAAKTQASQVIPKTVQSLYENGLENSLSKQLKPRASNKNKPEQWEEPDFQS